MNDAERREAKQRACGDRALLNYCTRLSPFRLFWGGCIQPTTKLGGRLILIGSRSLQVHDTACREDDYITLMSSSQPTRSRSHRQFIERHNASTCMQRWCSASGHATMTSTQSRKAVGGLEKAQRCLGVACGVKSLSSRAMDSSFGLLEYLLPVKYPRRPI